MSSEADVAYAYYPTNQGPDERGRQRLVQPAPISTIRSRGNYAWMGILHETGHALGLKHGHEFPLAISADRDSLEYSVMTYRSYPGRRHPSGGYTNETFGFPQTLMMLDIAALQKIYDGANYDVQQRQFGLHLEPDHRRDVDQRRRPGRAGRRTACS